MLAFAGPAGRQGEMGACKGQRKKCSEQNTGQMPQKQMAIAALNALPCWSSSFSVSILPDAWGFNENLVSTKPL